MSIAPAWAQVNAYTFTQSTGNTYSPITGGTQLSTTDDDNTYLITPGGGFSFVFNGVAYTQFYASANGYVAFGNADPGTTNRSAISGTRDNVVAVMSRDQAADAANGGELRWDLVGSSPNRTLVIQWKNYQRFSTSSTGLNDAFNYQIRLNENNNTIALAYGPTTLTNTTSSAAQVGLRGTSTDYANRTSTTSWTATTAGTTSSSSITLSSAVKPVNGLTYRFTPPACGAPVNVNVVPGVTSAQLSYAGPAQGAQIGYQYQYRPVTSPASAFIGPIPTSNTTINLSGLTANTTYEVQVQSNCGGGTFSAFTPLVQFQTLCSPSGTFTQNFEAPATTTPNLPSCWRKIVSGTGALVQTTTSGTPMNSQQAQLTAPSSASTAGRAILITPALLDLGTPGMQLRFRAKTSSTSGAVSLLVGTVNNTSPNAAFTAVNLPLPLTTSFQDFTIDFGNYAGSDQFIAFRHGQDMDGISTTIYVDNVVWETTPPCPTPSALQASQTGATRTLLTYTPSASNQVDVFYTTDATLDPNAGPSVPQVSGITGSSYNLTGLTANTTYYIYIRAYCSPSSSSTYIGPVQITTLRAPIDVNVTRQMAITYSPIGTGGTAVPFSGTGTDSQLSTAVSLPFAFSYLGNAVTQFKVSTDGWMTFDAAITSNTGTNNLNNTTYKRVLAPFWDDLHGRNITDIRYSVTGTAPNRVLTIEWANWGRWNNATNGSILNFQVKLHESTNDIQFVYGLMSGFTGATNTQYSYTLGLNGNPATPDFQIMSQQLENTRFFANVSENSLSIIPECNSQYTFEQNTPYVSYSPTVASAPVNDNCVNATSLTLGADPATTFCSGGAQPQVFTSANATASSGAPAVCAGNADDDVWFRFTTGPVASNNVTIRVAGSYNFDAVLQVYRGSCGAAVSPVCVNAAGAGLAESVAITGAPANTTYFVRVFNAGTGTGGNGTFAIDAFAVPDPPVNDNCATASSLTAGNTCVPVAGSTAGATASAAGTPAPCSGNADDDVWYSFTPSTTGAEITVVGAAGMNPVLQVLSGACSSLTSMGCVNATSAGGTEVLTVTSLTAGNTYFVRVFDAAAGFGTGDFTICIRQVTPVANDDPSGAGAASSYSLPVSQTCNPINGTTLNAYGPSTQAPAAPAGTADEDVFFSFVATGTNPTITVTGGTDFDAVIVLYSGTPGSLTQLAYRDATGSAATEVLNSTNLTIGTRYYVRVYDYSSGLGGTFTICVQQLVPPGNDEPTAAGAGSPYSLTPGTSCTPTSGYTNLATASAGIPAAVGTPDDDVFYSFVPTVASPTITVAGGSGFDAVVQLLSGTPGSFTSLGHADATFSGGTEELQATSLTPGTRYYVRVYDYYTNTPGSFTICVTQGPKVVSTVTGTQPTTTTVQRGAFLQPVLRVNFTVRGATGTLPLQSLTVRGANTSNADVTGVRLYASTSTTFNASTATLLGSAGFNASNNAVFSNLNYDLPIGTSYLYVTYNVSNTATIGNVLDAQILANQIVINGATYPSTALNPTGTRTIAPPPPAGDEPCNALALAVAQNGATPTYVQYTNVGASNSTPSTTGSCSLGLSFFDNDLYFRATVPATGELNIDVRSGTGTAIGDPRFMVYSGSCTGTLTVVGCSDNEGTGNRPAARIAGLTPGTQVLIRVGTITGPAGTFVIAASDRPLFLGTSSSAVTLQDNFLPAVDALTTFLAANTITVPAAAANMPTIGANATVGGLAIMSGATVSLTGTATLTIGNGGFSNRGTFNQATGSTVRIAGTTAVGLGTAGTTPVTFENLSIGPNGATMNGPVSVRRILTLDGNLTTNGRRLTLVSDATTTAMVVHNSGGVIGDATVQRYIDPSISQVDVTYRHLSAPVVTTISDLMVPGLFTVRVNPSWNADTTARPFPTVFGYNEARISSARPRFVDGYFSPNSTSDPMEIMRGYTALMPDGAHPDFVGQLNNGSYSRSSLTRGPLANQGWHLLGNPYPAPIDWSTVTNAQVTGTDGSISVLRSTDPNSANYVAYTNGVGSAQYVPVAQGFFIRVSSAGGTGQVSLTNANRITTYQNPTHYRPAQETRPLVKLTLVESGKPVFLGDETYVYFQAGATSGREDFFDAFKIRSTGSTPSLFSFASGEEMAINGMPELSNTQQTIVPLGVQVGLTGAYKFNAAELLNMPTGMQVLLRDALTGTEQDLTTNPTYVFTMDASFRGARFSLVFNPANRVTGLTTLATTQVAVWPNPAAAGSELHVRLTAVPTTAKTVAAQLIDAVGRVVTNRALPVVAGNAEGAISTQQLSKGVYILKLAVGEQTVTRRVVIE